MKVEEVAQNIKWKDKETDKWREKVRHREPSGGTARKRGVSEGRKWKGRNFERNKHFKT